MPRYVHAAHLASDSEAELQCGRSANFAPTHAQQHIPYQQPFVRIHATTLMHFLLP